MRCAIFTQGTSIRIPNENNFNTQTIAFNATPNGGKVRFRATFLNWIVDHNGPKPALAIAGYCHESAPIVASRLQFTDMLNKYNLIIL